MIFQTHFRRIAVFLTALLLAVPKQDCQALEQVTLQLKWTHAFEFAGYYMAREKGFYRDAGLNVDIREANPDTIAVRDVVQGRAEFGIGGSSLLLARKDGQPVVALAAIFQHSPLVLVSRSERLSEPRALPGKSIMLEQDAGELLAYFRHERLPLAALKTLPHSFKLHDLIEGKVDAQSAYLTNEPYWLQKAGVPFSIFSPLAAGIDFYGDILFTSEAELKRHPERVAAFRAASLRGWEYALEHIEETIDVVHHNYAPQLDRDYLRFEANQMLLLIRSELVGIGYMNPERWRNIAASYAQLEMLPADFPLAGFLYESSISDERLRQLYGYLTILLAALLLLAVIVGIVVRGNHRLAQSQREQEKQAARLKLQAEVLDRLNRDETLDQILVRLVDGFESHHAAVFCSVVLLDELGQSFRRVIAPSLPASYNQAVIGLPVGEGIGSCGTAAYRGERVVAEDILVHPFWQAYRAVVEPTGLRSCWSQPVKNSRGKVIGTFAVYQRQPATPNTEQIEEIESYASIAALAIERARARQEQRESEVRYRLIAENSTDVIWTLELPEMHFSYVSPSVQRLRGWSAEEVMAQPLAAALTPASLAVVEARLQDNLQQIANGRHDFRFAQMEIEQPCKDGSTIPTEVVTNIILDDDGKPWRMVGITRSIRERRRQEAEREEYRQTLEQLVAERTQALIRAKDQAEVASRAKSQFISNISHELRTPLNGIMGLGQILRRRIDDPELQAILDRQHRAEMDLLLLINNLIEVANITSGDPSRILHESDYQPGKLLARIRNTCQPSAQRKGLTLLSEITDTLESSILHGDANRIAQVLENLVGNAIKFSERGQITIAAHPARLDNQAPAITWEVRDEGIGISEAQQQQIFQLFEQGDGSSTRKYGGTGLGLALCKQLVELMGGEIGVSSQAGSGSRFWFSLPLVPGTELINSDA